MPTKTAPRLNPKIAVSVVYVAGMFMNILDTTIINVAIPAIAEDFGTTPSEVAAVAVAYLVALAVFIPVSGWLGDRFGNKKILLLALTLFTVASILCGIATSLPQLVGFRILQGAGGGLMMPVGMSMLMRTFPPAERVRASRILVVPTAVAPALGPIVGGALVTNFSWHWIFLLNVPVGSAAVVFGLVFLREDREPSVGAFDLPGFLLAASGLGLLMYALSEGSHMGWSSPVIVGTAIAGVVALAALVVVETRSRAPMLDLGIFRRNRLFRDAGLAITFTMAGFLGAMFVMPVQLQQGDGRSALYSGLATFPTAIGVMVASQLASKLYPVVGPRRVLMGGISLVSVMLFALALVPPGSPLWLVQVMMLVLGFGMAHVFIPSQTASFASVSKADSGSASTLYNVQRQVGSAVGVAVLSSVLAWIGTPIPGAGGDPDFSAFHWAFVVAGFLALGGVVFASRIVDTDAASTMVRPDTEAEREPTDSAATVGG
jgi:EmrB/QacA subfamily drug resistance transporter